MALFSRSGVAFSIELVRDGNAVIERMHVAGASEQRVELPDEPAALAAHRRRMAELIDEDWNLARIDDEDARGMEVRDAAIERMIADAGATERAALIAVYNDWLIERGDPCGEFAVLRAAMEPGHASDVQVGELIASIVRWEAAHGDRLFGPLAALTPRHREGLRFSWAHGWIDAIEFARTNGTLVTLALCAPMARFADKLVFSHPCPESVGSALAMRGGDRIRQLELNFPVGRYGAELLRAMPGLEELAMICGADPIAGHEHVRALALTLPLRDRAELAIAAVNAELDSGREEDDGTGGDAELAVQYPPERLYGAWPSLEHLVLDARDGASTLAELLGDATLPVLTELTLVGPYAERMARRVAQSPLAQQLRIVRLDGDAATLARIRADLPRLRVLPRDAPGGVTAPR